MTDELDALEPKDITVRILEQIRDEMRATRTDLGARIDTLREQVTGRLETVEHTLLDLATQQRATVAYLRDHVAGDLTDLRTRVSALEARAG